MKMVSQGEVLRARSQGAVVTGEYVNEPPSGAKKIYRLSTNNRAVRSNLITRMVAEGLLAPAGDAFSFGETQTYVLGPEMTAA